MNHPAQQPSEPPRDTRAHGSGLPHNPVSFLGWIVFLIAFVVVLILMGADLLFFQDQVYSSIVTYMVMPAFLIGGLLIVVVGYIWAWRRGLRKGAVASTYPRIDLNLRAHRRTLVYGIALLTVFGVLSALGSYRAYHVTESVAFCGITCHKVMEPEHTAYLASPHARVDCVACHVGSGATWYVKSKMSGLYQVYSYAFEAYSLPIEVPIHNLRPAQDTCEQCHWPEKFSGSIERTFWSFLDDEENTPLATKMLMKVGGGSPRTGPVEGIHWHTSRDHLVEYWTDDPKQESIPWVRVTHGDQVEVFTAEGAPENPPEHELRRMDCMDCHNRPSHIYYPPVKALSRAMGHGRIDRAIPNLFAVSRDLLSADYETKQAGLDAIEAGLREAYADTITPERLAETIREVQAVYDTNVFPEQGVDWRTYPNHLGHMEYIGCDRCHAGDHSSDTGKVITADCRACHEIVAQVEGEAAFGPIEYQAQEFIHPGGEGWEDFKCIDCHAAPPPVPATRGGQPKS